MEFMKKYEDSFLFEAFDDIIEWRNTGIVHPKKQYSQSNRRLYCNLSDVL
jgi:hypothetical protein